MKKIKKIQPSNVAKSKKNLPDFALEQDIATAAGQQGLVDETTQGNTPSHALDNETKGDGSTGIGNEPVLLADASTASQSATEPGLSSSLHAGATLQVPASGAAPLGALESIGQSLQPLFTAYAPAMAVGAGVVLVASNAHSSNSHPATSPQTPLTTTVNGTVVAGPVIGQNDLRLCAYSLLTGARVSDQPVQLHADGTFSMSIDDFTGPAVFVLTSSGDDAPDYVDEALGYATDLSDALAAIAVVVPGVQNLNVTPLSTIAALNLHIDLQGLNPSTTQLSLNGSSGWAGMSP